MRKDDAAHAAFHLEVNGYGRLAVELVGVLVAVVLQAVSVDGTDAAAGVDDDADVFRQANVGFADAAFDIRGEVGLAVASEIDIDLARSHVQIEAGDVNVAEAQIAAARRPYRF